MIGDCCHMSDVRPYGECAKPAGGPVGVLHVGAVQSGLALFPGMPCGSPSLRRTDIGTTECSN